MSNYVKAKAGISALSISIIILIPLLQSNFNTPVNVKRWSKLSWDDFQGLARPLSRYDAAIYSNVYLDYDSAKGGYYAYAGQHNVWSWVRESKSDYLLNHEQYHFNITELHARKLNEYIAENPDGTEYEYNLRLGSIDIDLREMQAKYDLETSHSQIIDKQRRWEYEIDSLLALSKGWVTDQFSGAQMFMTHVSDSSKGLIDGLPYRHYAQYKHGMQFTLTSYQASNIEYRPVVESIRRTILNRSERLKSFSLDTTESLRAFIISDDSANYTYYQSWISANSYLYQIKTRYPNNTGDTTGYASIASSFINSFRIVDTDDYWISKLEASDSPIISSSISKRDKNNPKSESQYCIDIGPPGQQGFYRGPFFREDGAMLLACDYLIHPDSLHYEDVMMINRQWYSHTPTSEGQVYFVPYKKIPEGQFNIKFGYILLQDSLEDCYRFYHQSLEVSPNILEIVKTDEFEDPHFPGSEKIKPSL